MSASGFIRVTITGPAPATGEALVNVQAIARLRKLSSGPRSVVKGTELLLVDGTVFQVGESLLDLTRAVGTPAR